MMVLKANAGDNGLPPMDADLIKFIQANRFVRFAWPLYNDDGVQTMEDFWNVMDDAKVETLKFKLAEKHRLDDARKKDHQQKVEKLVITWSPMTEDVLRKNKEEEKVNQVALLRKAFDSGKLIEQIQQVQMNLNVWESDEKFKDFIHRHQERGETEVARWLADSMTSQKAEEAKIGFIPVIKGPENKAGKEVGQTFNLNLMAFQRVDGKIVLKRATIKKEVAIKREESCWFFCGNVREEEATMKAIANQAVMEAFFAKYFKGIFAANNIKLIAPPNEEL